MELILVRHAQTTSNLVRALDTALPGADLTDLGVEQVAGLAARVGEVDAVYSSPALRARRTALALDPDPQLRAGLAEIGAGGWEMSVEEAHAEEYRRIVRSWLDGDLDVRVPGGEDGHEFLTRFDAVVDEVGGSGAGRVAVVSHGAALRTWCGIRVPDLPPELPREHVLPNTGIVRVAGDVGAWTATSWDDLPVGRRGPRRGPRP